MLIELAAPQALVVTAACWAFVIFGGRLLLGPLTRRQVAADLVACCLVTGLATTSLVLAVLASYGYWAYSSRRAGQAVQGRLLILTYLLAIQLIAFSGLDDALRLRGGLSGWAVTVPYLLLAGIGLLLAAGLRGPVRALVTTLAKVTPVSATLLLFTTIGYGGQLALALVAAWLKVPANYALALLLVFAWLDLLLALATGSLIQSYARELRARLAQAAAAQQVALAEENNARFQALRRERHDLKNLLLGVQGHLKQGEIAEASSQLAALTDQQTDQLQRATALTTAAAKLPLAGLQNLIVTKAARITSANPRALLSLEVSNRIGELAVAEATLVRIAGILLDNAAEAVKAQTSPKVQIAFLRHGHNYEFTVTNSLTTPVTVSQLFASGYTTKAGHSGIGLATVDQLVKADANLSLEATTSDDPLRKGGGLMLRAIILEDDQSQRGFFEQLVTNRIMINPSPHHYDMEVALVTGQGQAVIDYAAAHPQEPLLLITDIELTDQEMTGIDVAAKLRQTSAFATIIFVSSYPEYLPLTISRQVEPLDFIYKGAGAEEVTEKLRAAIDVAYQRYQKGFAARAPQLFTYSPMPGILRQVELSRIYYIRSVKDQRRQLQIVGQGLNVVYRGELAKIDSPALLRVDRSVLVNPQAIDHFDAQQRRLYFDSAGTIFYPCSVRKVAAVKQYLQTHAQQ